MLVLHLQKVALPKDHQKYGFCVMENFEKVNAYVNGFSQENGVIFSQNQYSYPIINHTLVVPCQPGDPEFSTPTDVSMS